MPVVPSLKQLCALGLIVVGFFANPWFIGVLFTPFGPITKADQVFLIGLFDITCLVLGVLLWRYQKSVWDFFRPIGVNGAIVVTSLVVCLGGLELILRTGWFDNLDSSHPVWVPARFVDQNHAINDINFGFSANNPYQFNDILRTKEKKAGRYRIAVLGDSFVWGDGVPYDDAWGHILERQVTSQYNGVEVMSWGKPGWSTKRQLRFLKEEGYTYAPDLLIVGFVFNDLDLGTPQNVFTWEKVPPFPVLHFLFPNAFGFVASHLNGVVSATLLPSFSNETWVRSLYDDAHKVGYREVLHEMSEVAKANNIRLLFVLTPATHEALYAEYHNQITPLLEEEGIEYLDLYPAVAQQLATSSPRSLWANPANAHPGRALTHLYAQEVFDYIKTNAARLRFTGK